MALALPLTLVIIQILLPSVRYDWNTGLVIIALIFSLSLWIYTILSVGLRPFALTHSMVSVWLVYVPALSHISNGYFPFFSLMYSNHLLMQVGIICVLHELFFFISYVVYDSRLKLETSIPISSSIEWGKLYKIVFALNIVGILFIIYFGINFYLEKRSENINMDGGKAIVLIGLTYPRAIPVVTLVASALLYRVKRYKLPMIVSIVVSIVLLWPESAPRVQVIGAFLAVGFILFDMSNRFAKLLFSGASFIGVVLVLPVLNLISRAANDTDFSLDRVFTSGDFGQYQGLLTAIDWVNNKGLTLGVQFLGWFTFYIPRAIWEGKPLSTGEVSAEDANLPFTNFSVPFPGELYVDWGWFGLVMLSTVMAIFAAKLDKVAYLHRRRLSISVLPIAIAFGMSGMFYRGSTISVLPLTAVPVVLSAIIVLMLKRRRPYSLKSGREVFGRRLRGKDA